MSFLNICLFCNGAPGQCRCGQPMMTVREWQRETGDEYDIVLGED